MLLRGCCWSFIACVLLSQAGGLLTGQEPPAFERSEFAEMPFIPQDRQLRSLVERARAQLTEPEGDRRIGLEIVQEILNDAEDYFADNGLDSSLRGDAYALLAELPPEVLRQYEQTYGGEARALLTAAAPGDDQTRSAVIRRFLFTQAGADAAFAKAAIEFDRGNFLTAARLFDRIAHLPDGVSQFGQMARQRAVRAYWKAGIPRRSEELFLRLLADSGPNVTWNDQPIPEFANDGEAAQWLSEQLGKAGSPRDAAAANWLMSGGAPDRNAAVGTVSPIFDNAWRQPLLSAADAPSRERLAELQITIDSLSSQLRNEESMRSFSVAEPLVIGETVVFSSYGRLKAVDARTGKLQWHAADADPVYEHLAHNLNAVTASTPSMGTSPIDDFLAQRAWLDATSASLSSDGHRVYEVFDSGIVLPQQNYGMSGSVAQPLSPPSYNRLRAYDLPTEGKLLWEVGGPSGRIALPLAGTFFLGAPLPVDGSLYAIGEDRGQVRLIVLNAETGAVEWSLGLFNTVEDINLDVERRFAGLSPSLSGGLLICPTGGGLVVAVDVNSRSLVWGHVYSEPKPTRSFNAVGGRIGFNEAVESLPTTRGLLGTSRWYGPSTLIAGRFVLHAPPDDPSLHCLDLMSGETVWSRPRDRLLYVATVFDEAAVLVGERHVEAVQLSSGEQLWTIPMSVPSGLGVRQGSLYHLPLEQGAIATIDLSDGELLARSSTRSDAELGTLVAANGRLFTQTATELRGFRSIDELHTQIAADLEADPDDPAALAVRGEMQLHAGQTDDALASLRASFRAAPDERVRQLIADTLMERLREDFAENRDTIAELEQLTVGSQNQIRLLRTIAEGLESEGELIAAYERYLQLLRLPGLDNSFVHPTPDRKVRLDRWVQGRLQRIYELSVAGTRPALDQKSQSFIASVTSKDDVPSLVTASSAFSWHPAGKRAEAALAEKLNPEQTQHRVEALRAEATWLRLRREGNENERANATAKLAQLYADHGRGELVEGLLRVLTEHYSETTLGDGQTGGQFAAKMRETPAVAQLLAEVVHWPTESVKVRKQDGTRQQRTLPLRTSGPIDPLFAASGFASDTRGEVIAFDGIGHEEWTLQIPSETGHGYPQSHYVERRGHRALLFLSNQFRLVDMLTYGQRPRTIVDESLVDGAGDNVRGRTIMQPRIDRMGLRTHWRSEGGSGNFLGNAGPIRDHHFCFQRGDTLFAVDPFDGSEFWRVEDLPYGCEILADEQYVILIPPEHGDDRQVAHLYQVADGAFVRAQRLPPEMERNRHGADWGRLILTKTKHPGTQDVTLAMFDPVSGKNVWERRIPRYHSWTPRDGDDLVVLDDAGRVQLLDAETGETLFETKTDIAASVKSITVLSHPDEWFLFSERRPDDQQSVRLVLPHSRPEFHAVNGLAYGFDRGTNDQLWSREVFSLLLDPSLPGRWPLLVLSSEAYDGRRRAMTKFQNLLLLNKRTGDIVFEEDGSGRGQGTSWTISDEEPQLQLTFGSTDLSVTFSDEPVDEASEPGAAPPPDDETPTIDGEPPSPIRQRVPSPLAPPPLGEEM